MSGKSKLQQLSSTIRSKDAAQDESTIVGDVPWLLVLTGTIAAIYLVPIETGIMTAFKTQDGYLTSLPFLPPRTVTLAPWQEAWNTLSGSFFNSLAFTVPATILSATIGSLAAYGLTNTKWRGQTLIFVFFVAGTFIPIQSVLVPVSRFWAIVDIENVLQSVTPLDLWGLSFMEPHYATIVELILTHTAFGIPIATLLFRSYYKNLSDEMLEAARIDGAGLMSIYKNIVLPLSKPIFIVTFIYQFTSIWNGLLLSLIVAGAGPAAPITVDLNKLALAGRIPTYNTMMAGAFITAIPTLIIYIFFGDKFVRGVAGYGGS
ncbi:carbohydrate ABC transporter permease [Haloarcula marina]|uniref:carbohydrate ABC transporter permease n=1 Tax=Haloarcula marina TaxID=2961574 RepID=UPI0020B72BE5|nr:carbohydrate ABC transporter permease [Halomicroarcula marina]